MKTYMSRLPSPALTH